MRNFRIAVLLLVLGSIGLYSCSSSDTEWRDDNLVFFDGLADKSGIQVLGDTTNGYPGIYYTVKLIGTGAKPIIGNEVKLAYSGWLWNDTTSYDSPLDADNAFDASSDGTTFTVGSGLIEGLNLAVQNMTVGSKWRVFIPYYLGYGSSGTTSIPAYSTLIFDVYLKEITSDN
jgi:FKBP-type peptidyl-prolyl cis-trans isomerase FklB